VKRAVALALAVAIAASSSRARAQTPPECEARLRVITDTLDADARRTHVWYWSWMAAGTALLVGQGVLAAVTTDDQRIEFATGSAASTFIPGLLLLHPPRVFEADDALHARLEATTAGARLGDPCIALPRAQELLAGVARDQAFATGWFAHTFIIAGNAFLGLLLGLGFHDWFGGAKQFVGGSLVGELQIFTLPTGALRAQGLGLAGSF
jgi:hypothetical protein